MSCDLSDPLLDKWLAEAVGIKLHWFPDRDGELDGPFAGPEDLSFEPGAVNAGERWEPTKNLNQIARVERTMKLTHGQYISALKKAVQKRGQFQATEYQVITATARQRAEAIYSCHA